MLTLALLAAFLACAPTYGIKDGEKPSFLLITLCSTRRDRLGVYGYTRYETTPNLDKLAERGHVFESAWATGTWTNASHASILTGLIPGHHLLQNDRDSLPPAIPVLPEILKANGWRTAALLQEAGRMTIGGNEGLTRGFDEVWNYSYVPTWSPDDLVTWVAASQEPWFALVHLREAHMPYGDGSPFTTQLHPDIGTWAASMPRPGSPIPAPFWDQATDPLSWLLEKDADPEVAASVEQAYASGVRAADTSIGRLLDGLAAKKRLQDLVVIVVADHGEALGEDETWGHKSLITWPVAHIPLIIRLPRDWHGGRRVTTDVGQVDLLPTIAELAGILPPAGMDGRSLVPALAGEQLVPVPALTQNFAVAGGINPIRNEGVSMEGYRLNQTFEAGEWVERWSAGTWHTEPATGPEVDRFRAWREELGKGSSFADQPTQPTPEQVEDMHRRGYW